MANINNYIDYYGLFNMLYVEHRYELTNELEYEEYPHYEQIYNFFERLMPDFELLTDECSITHKTILFCFGKDFNDANESCSQSTTADVIIEYDLEYEDFVYYSYDQG